MAKKENILISLESRHAKNIYAGNKLVELRRRTMHIQPGSTVWIYEKVPVGSITGCVIVKAVHTATPTQLWRKFGAVSGLSRTEFFSYFSDITEACALVLEKAKPLLNPLSLPFLREVASGFQPPQFFIRLPDEHPFLAELNSHPRSEKNNLKSFDELCELTTA